METDERHIFDDIVKCVGEQFQNHPLELVNENMLHPRLVSKFDRKLNSKYLPAHLDTEYKEWNSKWKMKLWDDMDESELGKVSRLRSEVCFPDWEKEEDKKGDDKSRPSKKDYFDIVLFDDDQEQLQLISKSKGPGNWFSISNEVKLVAEVKHSKTADEKDFYKEEKGLKDIQRLSQFPKTGVKRVFIFATHYPINHHTGQERVADWWEQLENNLNEETEQFESPVAVYYIPRKYDTDSELPIERKIARKTEEGIKLEDTDSSNSL